MKLSQVFTKTRREGPKDETSKNSQILIRSGFIHKFQAGVYGYLPLGLKVIQKITQIVREEMNAIGGQEITMSAIQEKELWEKTGRWSDDVIDNWFKTKLANDTEVGLGLTHEEPITVMMQDHIRSFRDLPVFAYQFQTKFRNEKRAKSGILRSREFIMKDLYSFTTTPEQHAEFYEKAKQAYVNIFKRAGVGDRTFVTFASGGIFAKYSHEFQMLTDAGEDIIYIDRKKNIAVNKEVYNDEVLANLELNKDELEVGKAVEVGNIFSLGTRFSDSLGLTYKNEEGAEVPVVMGSYGIGIPRLMGAIVEAYGKVEGVATDKGGEKVSMIWPLSVSPAVVHIVHVGASEDSKIRATKLYADCLTRKIDVMFDDRDGLRAGEKFADADLIGVPLRIIVGDKSEEKNGEKTVEFIDRRTIHKGVAAEYLAHEEVLGKIESIVAKEV